MPAAAVEPTTYRGEPTRVPSTYHTSFPRHDAIGEAFTGEPVVAFPILADADGHRPVVVPLFPSFSH